MSDPNGATSYIDAMDALRLDPLLRRWFRKRLLTWFKNHARDLPWRHTRDPYAIWVSEVMLQQTQVATVIPYFARFLDAFPTLMALALAPEQQVLRLWEGLGYYRRARFMHQAAQALHEQGFGNVPDDPATVQALQGLGRYTVNAVLSQAFDRRLPIVEANSERVLCRLLGVRESPKAPHVRRLLWQVAEELLPRTQAGQFNQALMELGALLCTPAAAKCAGCPLRKHCRAFREGAQEQIPARTLPVPIEEVRAVAVVVRRRDKVLLVQRPPQGRWASLWEFPHVELAKGETGQAGIVRLLGELGLQAKCGKEVTTVRHSVTRFRITLSCVEAHHIRGRCRSSFYAQAHWVAATDLHDYPVSSPQRKLAQLILAQAAAAG